MNEGNGMTNNFVAILASDNSYKLKHKFDTTLERISAKGIPIHVTGTAVVENFGFFNLCYSKNVRAWPKNNFSPAPLDDPRFFAALVGEIYNMDSFNNRHRAGISQSNNPRGVFFERVWHMLSSKEHNSAFSELNGCFNILVFDKVTKVLYVVTDRHATIPVFAFAVNGHFFIGTESTLLANFSDRSATLVDTEGLIQKITLGYILGNGTLIKNCIILPPAHVCEFKANTDASFRRYWHYAYSAKSISKNEAVDTYLHLFKQAIVRRTENRRTIVPLSGGKDSRTIAMAYDLVYQHNHSQIDSFTYGETGANDLTFGTAIAETLSWPHQKYYLQHDFPVQYGPLGSFLTGAIFGCFAINGIELADRLHQKGDILLIGTAGDVLTGSFLSDDLYIQRAPSLDKFVQYLLNLFNGIFPASEAGLLIPNCKIDSIDFLLNQIRSSLNSLPAYKSFADLYDHFNLSQRHCKWLHIGTNFWKSSIMVGMPFYDNDLFDFLITLPKSLRKNQKISIETFNKFYPSLARIPDCHTGMSLTASSWLLQLWRLSKKRHARYILKKIGWDPFRIQNKPVARYSDWISTYLRQEFSHILTSKQSHIKNFLNAQNIQQVLEEHLSGKRNHTSKIDTLIALEYMLRNLPL